MLDRVAPRTVLDLGVGSGLVAEKVLDRLPDVRLVGVDFSPAMLAHARPRLARFGDRSRLVEADLAQPAAIELPVATFDAAISVQTLHNMQPDAQQRGLSWLAERLVPGGVALLLDKVAIPGELYDAYAALVELPETAREHDAREAADGEQPPLLETQLRWLRAAGLSPAVLDARANYALIAAHRGEAVRPVA